MAATLHRVDWVIAPVQMNPIEPLKADWHWTATNGLELERGLITNMTITDAFWWLHEHLRNEPGRFVATLTQEGGGEMWAGHIPK